MSGHGTTLRGADLSASEDSGDENGPKFDFSSFVKDSKSSEEGQCFKPALRLFSHSYLGDMKDVPRCQISAPYSRMTCRLPFWIGPGPVYPGQIVPITGQHILMNDDGELRLHEIVNRESQHAGLIAVLPYPSTPNKSVHTDGFRGWIAQVLQLRDDGRCALVQGVGFCTFVGWNRANFSTKIAEVSNMDGVEVEICMETWPTTAGSGSQLDGLLDLAEKAQRVFQRNHPQVAPFEGDPLQVSYWLATNMPLPCEERQQLFDKQPHARLESILELSSVYTNVQCRDCKIQVADAKDLIQVVDQGPSLVCMYLDFQNIRPIICFSSVNVGGTRLDIGPTTSYWLPGYHQQWIFCSCGNPLGWAFTAWEANMPIQKFFALKHVFIAPKILDEASEPAEDGS